jgi:hypothetical protein
MAIVIEGLQNLELLKRMALSHIVCCSSKSLRSHTEEDEFKYEADIESAQKMVDAAASQISMIKITEEG